jgi:aminoglycoside phosphotransferase family enzyme/predicted kinase
MRAPGAAIAETHISVVVMIGDRAVKLLKPIALPFLDHRRREDRLRACRRETEVNRRFAPDVYLGVLDVLDEHGEAVDHLIAMRRMPADRRLVALLGTPEAAARVSEAADVVARFHREAPTSAEISAAGSPAALRALWAEGLGQLREAAEGILAADDIDRAEALAMEYLEGRAALLESRIEDGWVRDGHGDLLADDVFCLDDGPRFLDCLAFDDRLRYGDVLMDVAFLAMDLEARGHPELATRLVDDWARRLGEPHPASLAHHYVAYRAHVRAKVACLKAAQGDDRAAARARELHALTLARLERGRVRLALVGGAPGTGKSTVAAAVADRPGWSVVRSDEVRKDLAGLARVPAPPSGYRQGLYGSEVTDRVYAELMERAGRRLALGESVVLDASWGEAHRRAAARAVAAGAHAGLVEIECTAPAEVAAERIRARRSRGEGPSDATAELAARMAQAADPWPEARRLPTDRPLAATIEGARRLLGPS